MARHPDALICGGCGASSPLPSDPQALAFDCQYCGNHQLLPQRVVDQRRKQIEKQQREQQRKRSAQQRWAELEQVRVEEMAASSSSSSGSVIGTVIMLVVLGLGVAIAIVVYLVIDEATSAAPIEFVGTKPETLESPKSAEPAEPTPAPLPEETDDNNGLADIRGRMAALHEAGCTRVLVPPTRYIRKIDITAVFGKPNCVVMLGATGMPETTLELGVTDGHGSQVETPPAGPAFEWRYCAKLEGEHRVSIEHEGRGPYHIAAYDCPKRPFNKLGPVAAPFAPIEVEDDGS
jgi:hypothetical protein